MQVAGVRRACKDLPPRNLNKGGGVLEAGVQEGNVKRNHCLAFDSFASTRLPALLRFGYVLTGDAGVAAHLVQRALVRCGLCWSRLARDGNPEGYVRRAMVTDCVRVRRRLLRKHVSALSPEGGCQPQHRENAVWTALAALTPRERAMVLRYYDDFSEAHIADVLGCTVGTVRIQSARAMGKLRAALEQPQAREAQ
jgi:RNA polymerase sigma factor (sigma-70 family)